MIAAYYPIKLIKFYSMESFEQGLKAKITRDLREGRVSTNLILLTIGAGGLRLTRNQLDVIFEWMVQNTNVWRVHTYTDEKIVVVFSHSPFHPEEWDNYEDYKHVMRQMFDDYGTGDFFTARTTVEESGRIWRNLKDLRKTEEPARVARFDYVRMALGGEKALAMILDINDNNETLVAILSGTGKGQKYWATSNEAMEVIPNDVAISELVRLKEEWKNEKRKQSQEAARIELQNKYGNIRPGTYLKNGKALYIVESVDMDAAKATAVRLVDLGIDFPANAKCVLPLDNKGFRIATPEEVAKILVKEYCNE